MRAHKNERAPVREAPEALRAKMKKSLVSRARTATHRRITITLCRRAAHLFDCEFEELAPNCREVGTHARPDVNDDGAQLLRQRGV